MAKYSVEPVNREVTFADDEIIVSKTDTRGRITYANDVFCDIAEFEEAELINEPHSILRHPDMPRCVFKLLWDTIEAKNEIFAYVKNMTRSGAYYWVFAHVTASTDVDGNIVGYHSNRRSPRKEAIAKIEPIYKALLAEEQKHADKRKGMDAGTALLLKTLEDAGVSYDEFVWSL